MVSLVGAGAGGMTPPFATPSPHPTKPASPKLTYDKPSSWKEHPDAGGFAAASFRAAKEPQPVDITATPLPGDAGGLLANVQRWCRQIQREPITAEELRKDLREINIAGKPAK